MAATSTNRHKPAGNGGGGEASGQEKAKAGGTPASGARTGLSGDDPRSNSSSGGGTNQGGSGAGAYNPASGTFHSLGSGPGSDASSISSARFRSFEDGGDANSVGQESDSLSNTGSCSGESEEHQGRTSNALGAGVHGVSTAGPATAGTLAQGTQAGGPGTSGGVTAAQDKKDKIRAKNEKKHLRQKEKKAQELRDKCTGFLTARKLELLAEQLVAMGFPKDRCMVALVCCDGSLERSVTWLLEGGGNESNTSKSPTTLKLDLSAELARMSELEMKFGFLRADIERAVIACEGDVEKAATMLMEKQRLNNHGANSGTSSSGVPGSQGSAGVSIQEGTIGYHGEGSSSSSLSPVLSPGMSPAASPGKLPIGRGGPGMYSYPGAPQMSHGQGRGAPGVGFPHPGHLGHQVRPAVPNAPGYGPAQMVPHDPQGKHVRYLNGQLPPQMLHQHPQHGTPTFQQVHKPGQQQQYINGTGVPMGKVAGQAPFHLQGQPPQGHHQPQQQTVQKQQQQQQPPKNRGQAVQGSIASQQQSLHPQQTQSRHPQAALPQGVLPKMPQQAHPQQMMTRPQSQQSLQQQSPHLSQQPGMNDTGTQPQHFHPLSASPSGQPGLMLGTPPVEQQQMQSQGGTSMAFAGGAALQQHQRSAGHQQQQHQHQHVPSSQLQSQQLGGPLQSQGQMQQKVAGMAQGQQIMSMAVLGQGVGQQGQGRGQAKTVGAGPGNFRPLGQQQQQQQLPGGGFAGFSATTSAQHQGFDGMTPATVSSGQQGSTPRPFSEMLPPGGYLGGGVDVQNGLGGSAFGLPGLGPDMSMAGLAVNLDGNTAASFAQFHPPPQQHHQHQQQQQLQGLSRPQVEVPYYLRNTWGTGSGGTGGLGSLSDAGGGMAANGALGATQFPLWSSESPFMSGSSAGTIPSHLSSVFAPSPSNQEGQQGGAFQNMWGTGLHSTTSGTGTAGAMATRAMSNAFSMTSSSEAVGGLAGQEGAFQQQNLPSFQLEHSVQQQQAQSRVLSSSSDPAASFSSWSPFAGDGGMRMAAGGILNLHGVDWSIPGTQLGSAAAAVQSADSASAWDSMASSLAGLSLSGSGTFSADAVKGMGEKPGSRPEAFESASCGSSFSDTSALAPGSNPSISSVAVGHGLGSSAGGGSGSSSANTCNNTSSSGREWTTPFAGKDFTSLLHASVPSTGL